MTYVLTRVRVSRETVVLPITVTSVSVYVPVQFTVLGSYRVTVIWEMSEALVTVDSEADDETTVLLSVTVLVPVLDK